MAQRTNKNECPPRIPSDHRSEFPSRIDSPNDVPSDPESEYPRHPLIPHDFPPLNDENKNSYSFENPYFKYPNDKYWEAESSESRTKSKLSSNPNLPLKSKNIDLGELTVPVTEWNLKEATLTREELRLVINILKLNIKAFAQNEADLGKFPSWKHKIDTGTHPPLRCKPRPLSFDKRQSLARELKDLEDAGIIRPSRSDWASPIVMVPKKNGLWRLCVDFRRLNLVAQCCQYPLPKIDDIFES